MIHRYTIAIFLLLLGAGAAGACSCIPTILEDVYENTPEVFVARAVSVEMVDPGCPGGGTWLWTFEKSGYWKGDDGNIAFVHTPCVGSLCGFDFEEGVEYVVFAGYEPSVDGLFTHLCTWTNEVRFAAETLAFLGEPLTVVGARNSSWSTVKSGY